MGWISVKEKIPFVGEKVRFLLDGYPFDGEFYAKCEIRNFYGDLKIGEYCFRAVKDGITINTMEATHWMPLPDLPI